MIALKAISAKSNACPAKLKVVKENGRLNKA